jgi:transposase
MMWVAVTGWAGPTTEEEAVLGSAFSPDGRLLAVGTLRARRLDAVEGRSRKVYADWLTQAGVDVKLTVELAALDPFRGYANAIRDELPDPIAVLDAFHVVELAGNVLDEIRRRVQQDTLHRRGHKNDPLYPIRRTLLTGEQHLTKRQRARLEQYLPLDDPTGKVELAWPIYQSGRGIANTSSVGRERAEKLLDVLHTCPHGEVARLGRPQRQWRPQTPAYLSTGSVNKRWHRSDQPDRQEEPTPRTRVPHLQALPAPHPPGHRRLTTLPAPAKAPVNHP